MGGAGEEGHYRLQVEYGMVKVIELRYSEEGGRR